MPIDPVSVAGCATMACASHRDVVAARRRKVGHRRDERADGFSSRVIRQLAPDHVGRDRRSARAVDAQHDRAHRHRRPRGADRLDQRLEPATSPFSGSKPLSPELINAGVDHRHRAARCAPSDAGALRAIVFAFDVPVLADGALVVELILVRERRRPVRRAARPRRGTVPRRSARGRRPPTSCAPSATPRTSCSYMSRVSHRSSPGAPACSVVCGELIRRGLVVADLLEVGRGADLVERAFQEDFVGRDALQIDAARRQQVDAIGGGGQVILAVAAVFEVGGDALAGFWKSRTASRSSCTFPQSGDSKSRSARSARSRCAGRSWRAAARPRSCARSARASRR